jgi:hypothetical protein
MIIFHRFVLGLKPRTKRETLVTTGTEIKHEYNYLCKGNRKHAIEFEFHEDRE